MIGRVQYEQAVYGSFPFWSRGYEVLARSAGCRDEWLAALKLASQRFGEPPTGIRLHPCLFAMSLLHGPWMIVGVFPQGQDDQGRPGALAFHGLFVHRWSYVRGGSNPFDYRPALRGDWTAGDQDRVLNRGSLAPPPRRIQAGAAAGLPEDQIRAVREALTRKQKVVVLSSEPLEGLAHRVWTELPGHVRRRASVATWAFRNENGFDLIAAPRGHGLKLDGSELVLVR